MKGILRILLLHVFDLTTSTLSMLADTPPLQPEALTFWEGKLVVMGWTIDFKLISLHMTESVTLVVKRKRGFRTPWKPFEIRVWKFTTSSALLQRQNWLWFRRGSRDAQAPRSSPKGANPANMP